MGKRNEDGSGLDCYRGKKKKWLVVVNRSMFESGVKIKQPTTQLEPKLSDSCHRNVHLRIKEASVLALQVECWT